MNQEKGIYTGEFYKDFHVWKEDIPIIVLQPQQLYYLIFDSGFSHSLSGTLRRTKDIFVFGCTVALRSNDLLSLRKENVESFNGITYLKVRSRKTGTFTKIKLPPYTDDILKRNKSRGQKLFKTTSQRNFNQNIKKLIEAAGWTQEYAKFRSKRAIPIIQYKPQKIEPITDSVIW